MRLEEGNCGRRLSIPPGVAAARGSTIIGDAGDPVKSTWNGLGVYSTTAGVGLSLGMSAGQRGKDGKRSAARAKEAVGRQRVWRGELGIVQWQRNRGGRWFASSIGARDGNSIGSSDEPAESRIWPPPAFGLAPASNTPSSEPPTHAAPLAGPC